MVAGGGRRDRHLGGARDGRRQDEEREPAPVGRVGLGQTVVGVDEVANGRERGGVVDLLGHVAGQAREREHLGPISAAQRRDRPEHQER